MSLPVATTISGIDSMAVLRRNVKVADGFTPMSAGQMETLRRRVQEEAGDGRFECPPQPSSARVLFSRLHEQQAEGRELAFRRVR